MFGPTPATDVFIEASGSDRMLGEIIERGRAGGRMSLVALHYAPVPTNFVQVLMKQFTIRGSFEYPAEVRGRHRAPGPTRPVGPDHPHPPLEQFDQGLALLEGSKDCGKVMITFGGDE